MQTLTESRSKSDLYSLRNTQTRITTQLKASKSRLPHARESLHRHIQSIREQAKPYLTNLKSTARSGKRNDLKLRVVSLQHLQKSYPCSKTSLQKINNLHNLHLTLRGLFRRGREEHCTGSRPLARSVPSVTESSKTDRTTKTQMRTCRSGQEYTSRQPYCDFTT